MSADLGLNKGGLGLSGPKATVSLSSSKSSYDGTEVTHVETLLDAGGTARLTTPGALSLEGALVSGDRVRVDAGSLSIASLQDMASYRSKSSSGSLGASVGLTPGGQVSVSGHVSQGSQTGDFASVGEQSGLYAGDGGFAIRVGGDTVLKGAVIASTAEASSNSLVTGTLEAQDIANREQWSADQVSLGGGIGGIGMDRGGAATATGGTALPGVSVAGVGTVTATPPMALSAGGSQSGTTRSAIGAGTIEVTGDAASRSVAATISRDTGTANDGALIRQFTDAKRAGVAQGFQAAQVLATETSAFFASRAREEDRLKAQAEEARQRGDAQAADSYTRQAEQLHEAYGPGSAARLVATAVSGAAGGDATGSLGGLVQASAVNVLQGLATQQVKALADELGGSAAENSAARAALQAVVGCAGQAAGGTGDCSAGAMGAASAVVLNQLLKSGPTPSTDKDGQPLSQSAGQARDALVSTLVAAVASGAGLDAASATLAARIETQNNSTVTPLGRYGPDTPERLHFEDVYEYDPAFRAAVKAVGGREAFEEAVKCARSPDSCATTAIQKAALDAFTLGANRLEGQARIDAWLCSGETPLLCGVQAVNAFNQTPLGVRLVGGMQALGGAGQAVSGTIMAYGGASTCVATAGAGCVVATLGGVNLGLGLDNAHTGFLSLRDGTPSPTLGGRVISTVSGASLETSEAIYGQINLAVGLGTMAAESALGQATARAGPKVSSLNNTASTVGGTVIPEVTATAEVGGSVFKDVNQNARNIVEADASRPTIIADRVADKIAKNGYKLPNGNMADAHAEIGAIQQAFDAGKTQGQSMNMTVSGKDVCGFCRGDIAAAADKAGLKSLTINAIDNDTLLPKKYIWNPGMKSIQEEKK
ncbi:hypothetical protein QE379_003892 [Sphingomonas sp. SORGH_AS 879]|nr:hypothetical protein [Sphingomonas sp. SORGH_AS_0879]